MRGGFDTVCGCFPVGRHYPGIADVVAREATSVSGLVVGFHPRDPWIDMPIVLVDVETTGRDPQVDRVIEVGLVKFVRGEVKSSRNWLVNPGVSISEEAREVHGIGDADVADSPPFAAIVPELVAELAGHIPAAYNALFDRGFLHAELARAGIELAVDGPPALMAAVTWLDPLVWIREVHRYEQGKRLSEVCARLGIPLEQAHRASADAEAAGRVLFAVANDLPKSYGELVRLQGHYAARQDVDLASQWRRR